MRNRLYYQVLLLLFTLSIIGTGLVATVSGSEEPNTNLMVVGGAEKPVHVDFFYNPTCAPCMKVLPFMEQYAKSHPETEIEFLNVSMNRTNALQFENIRSMYPQGKIYVPTVVLGNSFIQGEPNISSQFISAVESYRKNGQANGTFTDLGLTGFQTGDEITQTASVTPSPDDQETDGIYFFYNPTCGSCQKVLPIIEQYAREHPNIKINFNNISGNQKNIELFEKFRNMHPQETIHVPVVFVGDTLLQGEPNITEKFNSTVESYQKKSTPNAFLFDQGSSQEVSSVNLVVLLVAAIGEGLNPCGLLVLALLLVSLMATGTRRMVLFVGISYICAFFLIRLLSGFAIFSVIQLPGLATTFTLVAAAIAIIAGVIQIKDGLSKKQKPLLSIPESKKSLISSYMKKASIPGGFIVGVLVGIYGMACTAGIYISILGMVYKDVTSGLLYLSTLR